MINARVETLQAKFRNLLDRRRCLVPADGFYEWRTDPDGEAAAGALHPCGRAACSPSPACGRSGRTRRRGELLRSCTIVTCRPNAIVEPVHDRMPVILPCGRRGAPGSRRRSAVTRPASCSCRSRPSGWRSPRSRRWSAPRQRHRRAVRPELRRRAAARRAAGPDLAISLDDEQAPREPGRGRAQVAQRRRQRVVAALHDHEFRSHAREERVELLRPGMGDLDALYVEAGRAGRVGDALGGRPARPRGLPRRPAARVGAPRSPRPSRPRSASRSSCGGSGSCRPTTSTGSGRLQAAQRGGHPVGVAADEQQQRHVSAQSATSAAARPAGAVSTPIER